MDLAAIQKEEAEYLDMPIFYNFNGQKDVMLTNNFNNIYNDIAQLVKNALQSQSIKQVPTLLTNPLNNSLTNPLTNSSSIKQNPF